MVCGSPGEIAPAGLETIVRPKPSRVVDEQDEGEDDEKEEEDVEDDSEEEEEENGGGRGGSEMTRASRLIPLASALTMVWSSAQSWHWS